MPALFAAVASAEACFLEPEELLEAKALLEREALRATRQAEQRLAERRLRPAAELSFEVAKSGLKTEGYGGFDWKVREKVAFSTVLVGNELSNALDKAGSGRRRHLEGSLA